MNPRNQQNVGPGVRIPSEAAKTADDEKVGPPATPVFSSLSDDKQLSRLLLLGLTACAIYLTYIIFRPFLSALFVGIIMAIAFSPLHRWVLGRVRNSDAAALITTVVAMLAVVIPVVLVSARLAIEITSSSRSFLQQMGDPSSWPNQLDPLIEKTAESVGMSPAQLKSDITIRAREMGTWLLAFAAALAQRFARQMTTILLGSVFLFSILRSTEELRFGALSLLPLSPNRARELAIAVSQGVVANIYGMFFVGVTEGSLIALGFWLTGLRSPLLWGTIATVLSCLPVVGVSLVWVPGCVVLALRGNYVSAAFLFVWGVVMVSTADGIIRSRVVSGRVKINALVVTLSLMGGVSVFGAIGFFVGPVVVVVLASLLRILREEHASVQESRKLAA